jgi:hypothetical protein
MFCQKLVGVKLQSDTAFADMEEAKLTAKKAEITASKSLEIAQACKAEMKALESCMAALRKIHDNMVLKFLMSAGQRTVQCNSRGWPLLSLTKCLKTASSWLGSQLSEKEFAYCSQLTGLVVLCFLRELEIYMVMDSITTPLTMRHKPGRQPGL